NHDIISVIVNGIVNSKLNAKRLMTAASIRATQAMQAQATRAATLSSSSSSLSSSFTAAGVVVAVMILIVVIVGITAFALRAANGGRAKAYKRF
ncbi:hypothetical protein HK405_014139, partial [Cladochytrium tenue]